MIAPEHMDRWTRNQRLYESLKGMGLYVTPIFDENDPEKINSMVVAADLPWAGEMTMIPADSFASSADRMADADTSNVAHFRKPR